MVRPTFAQIDLAALKANYHALRAFLATEINGRPPELIAVVKANAYGHGLVPVARALEECGATMLACADIEEGVKLREAGVQLSILVFGALSISDLKGDLIGNENTVTLLGLVTSGSVGTPSSIMYLPIGSPKSDLTVLI